MLYDAIKIPASVLQPETGYSYVVIASWLLAILFFIYALFYFFEMAYVEYVRKQLFFNHVYLKKRSLMPFQRTVLNTYIPFYKKLTEQQRSAFEHRMVRLLNHFEFQGRGIDVTEEMKLIVTATLVKLTFGFRDYKIGSVERILIYPEAFYSETNKDYHKGEFNLGYKALVLSWKDVMHGYEIHNDNLNLAIHEFIHAIHFYYMRVRSRSTSAAIFIDAYHELKNDLDANESLKKRLVASDYLRDYAYTNQYEFLAVIVESFIETPRDFKSQFPEIYGKVKVMLSYNFAGY